MITDLVLIVAMLALSLLTHHYCGQQAAALLKQIEELQADNRALVEAIARHAGQPIMFKKPEKVPSETWYESKPKVTVKS